MARHAQVTCAFDAWTELTNAEDATGDISIELLTDNTPIWLEATATGTAPAGAEGTFSLIRFGDGWSEATIAEKFPGVSGAVRLWARPYSRPKTSGVTVKVAVSYG